MTIELAVIQQLMNEHIPFNKHLGIQVQDLQHGSAVLALPFREILIADPVRHVLHGGVLSTLIDTCGGAAVWTMVEAGDLVSTVDLRVDYLRPAPEADLLCEGTVQRLGNRVGVTEMRLFVTGRPEKLIATGKGVYNIRRSKMDHE